MLQWNDGNWEHRAFWGADEITYGTYGTAGSYAMGPLPPTGQWVRLAVPARLVGLEGSTLAGMAFTLYGGRATWDRAGKSSASNTVPPAIAVTTPTNNAAVSGSAVTVSAEASDSMGVAGVQFQLDGANLGTVVTSPPYRIAWDTFSTTDGSHTLTAVATDAAGNQATSSPVAVTVANSVSTVSVWVDDMLPPGAFSAADGGDAWSWVVSNPAPYSGAAANQSNNAGGLHQHYFYGATGQLTVNLGDVLFAYIYLTPASLPSEVMLQWNDGSWEHRAYWGANAITYGADGTAGRFYMGPMPPMGQWVRLAVPASAVGLEGRVLSGMAFTLFDGQATWDYAGKAAP
jgi:hypothetical protein